ncbi:hypothetical protein HanPSC8_Chr10g0407331 [Helianthus annuus]|nr:hypothetical protein HanPSC8_Chr10g0407331 [Helianthus annuus]
MISHDTIVNQLQIISLLRDYIQTQLPQQKALKLKKISLPNTLEIISRQQHYAF